MEVVSIERSTYEVIGLPLFQAEFLLWQAFLRND